MILKTIKSIIFNLTPPVIYRIIKSVIPDKRTVAENSATSPTPKQWHEIAPEGWDTQLPNNKNSWNDQKTVEIEVSKWADFLRNLAGSGPLGFSHEHNDLNQTRIVPFHNVHLTFAYVVALTAQHKNKISILDWGSGLGHYYQLATAVLPEVELDYHCVDLPLMVKQGQKLNPQVHWYADESFLYRKYDLVMVNGSLQYLKNWVDLIRKLSEVTRGYFFLTRIPVVMKWEGCIAIQHNPSYESSLLYKIFTEQEILDVVEKSGLRLTRELIVGDHIKVEGFSGSCELRGWLFKRSAE